MLLLVFKTRPLTGNDILVVLDFAFPLAISVENWIFASMAVNISINIINFTAKGKKFFFSWRTEYREWQIFRREGAV